MRTKTSVSTCNSYPVGHKKGVTVTNSHIVDYINANQSSRSCVLYDHVHVYYIIELFNLFSSVSLVVRTSQKL